MAVKKQKPPEPKTGFGRKSAKPRPFVALLFLVFGILSLLAIGDYEPNQVSEWNTEASGSNLIGVFGVGIAYHTLWMLGLAAYATPVLSFWMAYMFFRPFGGKIRLSKIPPLLLIFVSLSVFGAMYQIESANALEPGPVHLQDVSDNFFINGWGGYIGFFLYAGFLREFFGVVGTLVVFCLISAFCFAMVLVDNVFHDIRVVGSNWLTQWRANAGERAKRREERKAAKQKAAIERKKAELAKKQAEQEAKSGKVTDPEPDTAKPKTTSPIPGKKISLLGKKDDPEEALQPFAPIVEGPPDEPVAAPKKVSLRPAVAPSTGAAAAATPADSSGGSLRIIASEATRKAAVQMPESKGDYRFPGMQLLSEPAGPNQVIDDTVHQQTAEALVRTLDEFGVKVTTGDVHIGPVITRYDVYPAPGVRVEKILNLDKNIALNLKAVSVRILAPVPGKGCVGVEIPNRHPQAVYIRDILESEDWAAHKAEIPIALGKDVSGKPLIADLTKMPHLLIAGSTGSGKTVCINSIITSLLYHASPEDLRFVMVDPKIVEMQVYNDLPHMLVPVVTDPKKVPNALKYLLNEMERRYQCFAKIGVRNIAGYNAKMATNRKEALEAEARAAALDAELSPEERAAAASISVPRQLSFGEEEQPTKLPYIVCIVDELADLMMVAPADIETGIARLAQLARAAGIHLILATQRPSVNVITGVIKANLPSRIAFKVASKVDSRTILDTMGADQLIGKGDMLFLPPGSADLQRAQGAFVGDDEINGIVEHISSVNGPPEFDEQFQQNIEAGDEEGEAGDDGDWDDDLVPQAIEVIRTSKRASTSMLQRRLKIGYNRAARIMEILEAEGMVGPENGSSPREILMPLD